MSAVPPCRAFRVPPSSFILQPSAFSLLAIGCLGIAGQLVLLRELMAAFGGNEFSAGITVAAWILCEALGAWLAGHARLSLASAAPVGQRIVHRSSFLSALSILFSLAAVPAAMLVRPLLGVLPGETFSIPLLLLATFMVVFLPAAAHGALFVTAAALHAQPPPSRASSTTHPATGGVGSAYVWEGVGTVLAGLACFLLFNRMPSLAVVALFSLPLAAAAFRPPVPRPAPLVPLLVSAVALAAFIMAIPIERMAWGAAWRGQRVASVANSPYGKIVRLERAGQQLILCDGLPVLTVPTTETERIEELGLLPVLVHPLPRRVLTLGHDLAVPAALARFRPDIRVTAVQLDPLLARTCLAALSSDSSLITHHSSLITSHSDSSLLPPPFSLTIADPVSFLRSARDTSRSPASRVRTSEFGVRRFYDCIILTDAVPPNLGSSRLFALDFYRLCRSRLAPGGILAIAGPGNSTGLSPDLLSILLTRQRTLKATFDHVLPLAADFPLLLASDRPLSIATETVLVRLGRLSLQPKLLDSSYVTALLDPFRQQTFIAALQPGTADELPQHSSVSSPRELFLNMVRENRLASPAFGALYARLGSLSPRLLWLLGAVLLIVGLAGARSRGRPLASAAPVGQYSRGFAILTSGFSGAAVSSLLLFAWQVRFGSVYSGVALLVAAFMFGTVLGGILGSRPVLVGRSGPCPTAPRTSYNVHRFLVSDLVLAVCAAAAVILIHGGPASAFLLANCLAGACLGFQFALAGSIVHSPSSIVSASESAARRAGILTALDLAGGSLGGILTALVLVPVFGIGTAALSAGAVKLISALVQLAARRPRLPALI
jgi:spermidine synthase